jgi:hypothetical protein
MKSKGLGFPDNFMDIFGFQRVAPKIVKVAQEFSDRLVNRNQYQGDGTFTAQDFISKFLVTFDNPYIWEKNTPTITFDFSGVKRISPAFVNEAFAYFLQYTDKINLLKYFIFENIDPINRIIIEQELNSGYK